LAFPLQAPGSLRLTHLELEGYERLNRSIRIVHLEIEVNEQLLRAMESSVREVKERPKKEVQIFHHNDSDGLASGAILSRAFERADFQVQRSCLEKPYPKLLQKIYDQSGGLIVFADFAGRIAPLLSELNRSRNLTLILDHHIAVTSTDPLVHNLDPDLYGLKGDRDISGSTTCYLFARTLDPANKDLAHIAAIGAVGDGFFVDGCLAGENRDAATEAVKQGKLEIRRHEGGERYFLKTSKTPVACDELGAYLDTLGAAGYYQNGPDMGIDVCLEGASPESNQMLKKLQAIQQRAFEKEISKIQAGGLKKTPSIQWFHVEDRFEPMGVKMIGVFCDAIKNSKHTDPQRYIAGFQIIPNVIPGFGPIEFNEVKISMRVSAQMEAEIRANKKMGLNILLPEATNKLGGFSDACHSLTAATTVAIGKEEQLIEEMERILQE
jgi:single-stranded-DNA-specific exonuclease